MGWLLDHPDIHVTEVSDADTVSDDYSDEELLEDLEEAEPTFPVVHPFLLISGVTHSIIDCISLFSARQIILITT